MSDCFSVCINSFLGIPPLQKPNSLCQMPQMYNIKQKIPKIFLLLEPTHETTMAGFSSAVGPRVMLYFSPLLPPFSFDSFGKVSLQGKKTYTVTKKIDQASSFVTKVKVTKTHKHIQIY